ncbi:MAG: hypothetical protein ACRDUX_11280, partial [Mycobacterium sp.]
MRVLRILAILILTVELNGRCAPAGAQDTGATAAQPAAGATPLSVGDIGTQASEVAAELRAMHDATAEGAAGEELETQVFTFRQRVSDLWTQTDHLLRGTLRRAPLTAIASSWRTLRIELVGLQRQVDGYAQRDEADLQALERLRETWSWTLDRARRVEAPDTSMARIGAMLDSIGATRVQVERHRTRLLALQDSVARSLADVDAAAVRVADARHQLLAHVFTEAHPPIWRIAQH